MNKEGSANILSFMSPRAGVLVLGSDNISRIVKMQYFFFFFLLWAWIRQIFFTQKYIYTCRNDDHQGRVYQNCEFNYTPLPLPPAGLFCAWKLDGGGGLKLCLILMTCINRQYIACYCIKGLYNAAFLCRCWFSFILDDESVNMQKDTDKKSVYIVSDAQVTVMVIVRPSVPSSVCPSLQINLSVNKEFRSGSVYMIKVL